MPPTYPFEEFVLGCAEGRAAVWDPAKQDARSFLGLMTETEIIAFVGNNGLRDPQFQDPPQPLESVPHVMVDAYGFFSGDKWAYIAFYKSPFKEKWLIKSLKPNDRPNPRVLAKLREDSGLH
jgi:hypothetical protein